MSGYVGRVRDRLKNDLQVQRLLASIKDIWKTLQSSVLTKRVKVEIYFHLECEVIDLVHEYPSRNNAFFSEHDGWRCAQLVDITALEKRVRERTPCTLKFNTN